MLILLHDQTAQTIEVSLRQTMMHGPPGGAPDPPFWLVVVHVLDFALCPNECSVAFLNSSNETDSDTQTFPEIQKFLFFIAFEHDASSAALQAQHDPVQVV
jgi:hypothetical protein